MIDIKYKKIYDKFIENYKNIHINPWHNINEEELEDIFNYLVNSMDINDDYTFKYFIDFIIKRLSGYSDAHTQFELISPIPMNFKIFGNDILINYPNDLRGSRLLSINGIDINKIMKEIEEIITYGTEGKRRYELENYLFNKYVLFGLPSLRKYDELIFEIKKSDGQSIIRKFKKDEKYSKEELFDYNTYRYGGNATYRIIDNCLIYNHKSVQNRFKNEIETAISNLKKENLSNIDTIIIDIRGNTGGNSTLNDLLMNFLKENKDKKLICLTDYRVFSAGRYALRDLINLGATTIGEEISTPINCYGNSNWINIEGYNFTISECFFHPFLGWSASSKKEFAEEATEEKIIPYIFTPNILVEEKEEDYISNIDTILNYALDWCKKNKKSSKHTM